MSEDAMSTAEAPADHLTCSTSSASVAPGASGSNRSPDGKDDPKDETVYSDARGGLSIELPPTSEDTDEAERAKEAEAEPPARKRRIEESDGTVPCKYYLLSIKEMSTLSSFTDTCTVPLDEAKETELLKAGQRTMIIVSAIQRKLFAGYGVCLGAKAAAPTTPGKPYPNNITTDTSATSRGSTVRVGWVTVAPVDWKTIVRAEGPNNNADTTKQDAWVSWLASNASGCSTASTAEWVEVACERGMEICDAIDRASLSVLPADIRTLHDDPEGPRAVALRESLAKRAEQQAAASQRTAAAGRQGPPRGDGHHNHQHHRHADSSQQQLLAPRKENPPSSRPDVVGGAATMPEDPRDLRQHQHTPGAAAYEHHHQINASPSDLPPFSPQHYPLSHGHHHAAQPYYPYPHAPHPQGYYAPPPIQPYGQHLHNHPYSGYHVPSPQPQHGGYYYLSQGSSGAPPAHHHHARYAEPQPQYYGHPPESMYPQQLPPGQAQGFYANQLAPQPQQQQQPQPQQQSQQWQAWPPL